MQLFNYLHILVLTSHPPQAHNMRYAITDYNDSLIITTYLLNSACHMTLIVYTYIISNF